MTQEDKELLLTDLCGRLPYGVKVQNILDGSIYDLKEHLYCLPTALTSNFKPYLRPMSSMTDEEFSEMKQAYLNCSQDMTYAIFGGIDWLNKHHFDYRGLIEKGLALEAPEDMYKF